MGVSRDPHPTPIFSSGWRLAEKCTPPQYYVGVGVSRDPPRPNKIEGESSSPFPGKFHKKKFKPIFFFFFSENQCNLKMQGLNVVFCLINLGRIHGQTDITEAQSSTPGIVSLIVFSNGFQNIYENYFYFLLTTNFVNYFIL